MAKKAIIALKDVWKIYNMGTIEVPALKGVSVEIEEGDFVAIIGASGSGKSTMMNLVGCLDTPSKGAVFLDSQNISHLSESDIATLRGKTIGFIFQQYNLIPSLSAFANVVLPLELQEMNDAAAKIRAESVLTLVGLADKMNNLSSQLSGGQQQRVSIARCLVANPKVILADEPTGALDSITGREVIEILQQLWKKEKKTVIMVTHDLELAKFAQTKIVLKDGAIVSITKNNHVKEERV